MAPADGVMVFGAAGAWPARKPCCLCSCVSVLIVPASHPNTQLTNTRGEGAEKRRTGPEQRRHPLLYKCWALSPSLSVSVCLTSSPPHMHTDSKSEEESILYFQGGIWALLDGCCEVCKTDIIYTCTQRKSNCCLGLITVKSNF